MRQSSSVGFFAQNSRSLIDVEMMVKVLITVRFRLMLSAGRQRSAAEFPTAQLAADGRSDGMANLPAPG